VSGAAVGGNHEAANHLWELYHGGWAAPRIWFLGYAGVVRFGGLRIGGLSGIYKEQHYMLVGAGVLPGWCRCRPGQWPRVTLPTARLADICGPVSGSG
jgi:hypothetical protein